MTHTYNDAVNVNARLASKRRLRLSANIRTSSKHARALLWTSPQTIPQFTIAAATTEFASAAPSAKA